MYCVSDKDFWNCGNDSIMSLNDLKGEPVRSIPPKSGNRPWDIAVTRSGDLVYTAYNERTVNIVKNSQMKTGLDYGNGDLRVSVVPPLVTSCLSWSVMMVNKQKLGVL